jgi:geranylgeranyl pyrophosphate synthase
MDSKNSRYQQRINAWLENFLERQYPAAENAAETLLDAIRYALLSGGKRIRPLLAYATAEAIDLPIAKADAIAGSVEMIHAYSLIHDDLPPMDDDALRRGLPTCHIAFDEATAILAGDALQAMAFEALTLADSSADITVQLVRQLARACGASGMAGGQALDLQSENRQLNHQQLDQVHRLKTGALINATMSMTAALQSCLSQSQQQKIAAFSRHFGMAFQIMDDVLDVTGDTRILGKPVGSDADNNKATYPQLLGLDESVSSARRHIQQAAELLSDLPGDSRYLQQLGQWVLARQH